MLERDERSDLFHIQQEITKGLTSHLARTLQQVKRSKKTAARRQKVLTKFGDHLKHVEEFKELSKRGINAGKRIIEMEKEEKNNQKIIEVTENQYRTARKQEGE